MRKLSDLWASFLYRLFSHHEIEAFRNCLAERTISRNHRRGKKTVQRKGFARPARLNLGCGEILKEGFLNVDMIPAGDVTVDLRRHLPFESGCCELIFSEHCFEHFDYPSEIGGLLRECFRILKPGGELRFSVPDTEWPLGDYFHGMDAPYFRACKENHWHPADYTTRIEHINYHFRQSGEHRFAYDFETAAKLLETVGFVMISRRDFDPALDSAHRKVGSLFMSAFKPK
jgi:predicted SAM-dependent methyltransferase